MNKKNIRSEFIKNIISENESLNETLEKTTKDTIKNIVDEKVNETMRNLISEAEDEDTYEEEEVEPEETDDAVEDIDSTENSDDTETENPDEETTDSDVEVADDTEGSETDSEDVWNDLEQYKGEDGEYDLTGMDKDSVIKVLKVMKPEDGVRVVQNVNGSITLSDDETEKEYIIDIDSSFGEENEDETDIDFDDDMNESVGYTDNYQKKTAMTTPDNHEPADSKNTYSMDDGVPTGTEKPWAGKGDNSPYCENVTEEREFEIEMDGEDDVDESMTVGNGAQSNSVVKSHATNNLTRPVPRNGSVAGRKVKGTSDARYSDTQMENIMRKANSIFNENKQLKNIAKKITEKLTEATVINHSLGKIIKLVTENTTTRDEKINIVKRFNDVKTINESTNLYNTISKELKSVNTVNNDINKGNVQIAESKKKDNVVETSIYQSEDLQETINLMERMEKI